MTSDELQRIVDSRHAHTPMTVALAKELLIAKAQIEGLILEVEGLVTDTQDEARNGEWHDKYAGLRAVLSQVHSVLTLSPSHGAYEALKIIDDINLVAGRLAPLSDECVCAHILITDESRHFRECPLRMKYPDPPLKDKP